MYKRNFPIIRPSVWNVNTSCATLLSCDPLLWRFLHVCDQVCVWYLSLCVYMSCGGGGVGSVEVTVDSSEQIKINDFPCRARALYFSITVHRHALPLSHTHTHTHTHTESSADCMCTEVCVGKRQEMLLNPQTHTEFPLSYALTHTRNHKSLGRLCFN